MRRADVKSTEHFERRVSIVFVDGMCLDATKPTPFDPYYKCLLTAPDGRRLNYRRRTLEAAIDRAAERP